MSGHTIQLNCIKLSLVLWGLLAMTACSSGRDTHISPQALLEAIQNNEKTTNKIPIIVDVRSQGEYESGHVPGAIHIPFWSAFSRASELPEQAKGQALVVYCAHGPRAGIAKWAFSLNGYESILYLTGHMSAWNEAKLPIEQ